MQIPEVCEKLAEMMAAHWRGGVDEKVPALGGETPRSAVKTPEGAGKASKPCCSWRKGEPDRI